MIPARVVVGTRNAGKLHELRALFAPVGVELVDPESLGLAELAIEEGLEIFSTFEANALAKAHYFHALSGLPAVADDSGLAVDALGGAPGVHSKRYAGASGPTDVVDRSNKDLLLREMRDLVDRRARFVCAAAFVDGPREIVARGETFGRILAEERGLLGFGYDPLFLSDDLGVTFGEADVGAKEVVSHRGRAFRGLLEQIAVDAGRPSVDASREAN